jgi:membrane protease YdiL (CAAX protease family)
MLTTRVSWPRDVLLFFALACGITWALDLPLALAWIRHEIPSGGALGCAGLSAFGPAFAALIVSSIQGARRQTVGHRRANPAWILVALSVPAMLHLPATIVDVLLGGHPQQWFYPPARPENIAALVVFPIGEELGWRGFAYPRLADRLGPVVGSLILGSVWGIWHLAMMVTPEGALPGLGTVAYFVVQLALYSVVMAWILERTNRSLLVAIAMHAGAHLDNTDQAPMSEVRLVALRFAVLAGVAALAAWDLQARPRVALGGHGQPALVPGRPGDAHRQDPEQDRR